jgi:HlyD family secretion protein
VLSVPGVIDLVDPTSLYVAAPMDEVDSGRLAVGQRAIVTIDSRPGERHPGRVARIAPYVLDVESQNRTVEIEVELEDQELSQRLLPGTSADVEVVLEQRPDVLRLPTATLLEGGRVLVVEEGVLAERRVGTGLRNWDWVEIREGLSAGDEVVSTLDRVEIVPGAAVVVERGGGGGAGP